MKKLILVVILGIMVVSCELFDPKGWREADRRAAEMGRRCYRRANGEYYCKDRYGNRVD